MSEQPRFASLGETADQIDVRLSYRIVELFSEGLYASPNKAVEELVANSFDAGAQRVHVVLSRNLHAQDATIAVIDDGEGMDHEGLKQHWLIGISNKRNLSALPRSRQQIGKFGIGKLATYVLANRLTHISKRNNAYHSTSMDYRVLDTRVAKDVEPKKPVRIDLRRLTEEQAATAVAPWVDTAKFQDSGIVLFGDDCATSWTVSIMSSLKPKVHEIRPGVLRWILRTALPLRPDFNIWHNGDRLIPSKVDKPVAKRWVLGSDLVDLPRPAPTDIVKSEEDPSSDEHRFGLDVPGVGRVTGYAEAYKDLLTGGKSDELGRSHGFFVYVYGRLLNVADGHFGISPNELRHGSFGRCRIVVHMDGLDAELRSNREAVGDGPMLATAQDVLRGIFNTVRAVVEKHDETEEPGKKLARQLAASPASLSRTPIIDLVRAVVEGTATARHLVIPEATASVSAADVLEILEDRAQEAQEFVTDVRIDFEYSPSEAMVRYDTLTGALRINGWHPFVATFYEEFRNQRKRQPLELLAMAETLTEAHLHAIGMSRSHIEEFLSARDALLRCLANESGRDSVVSIAQTLSDSRNNPQALEDSVCKAFRSLGFDTTHLGKKGTPDGLAIAHLAPDDAGQPQHYKVSLEAKSKQDPTKTVSEKDVNVSAVVRHRRKYDCDHAVVVAPAFPTTKGASSALAESIQDDRARALKAGQRRTITLVTVDDLARLVMLRPTKQIGLVYLRRLFEECQLPQESAEWVDEVEQISIEGPPYRQIVETIEAQQRQFRSERVTYSALRVALTHLREPIVYERDEELADICGALMQMAPGALYASDERVELDQSAENVIEAIKAALAEYPAEHREAWGGVD